MLQNVIKIANVIHEQMQYVVLQCAASMNAYGNNHHQHECLWPQQMQ